MLNINSYAVENGEWIIVTSNNVTIEPSIAREVAVAIRSMLNAYEDVSFECVVSTLNAFKEMRECAEHLTRLANEGIDVDGDYMTTLVDMYL